MLRCRDKIHRKIPLKKKSELKIAAIWREITASYHEYNCSCGSCSLERLHAMNIGNYERLIEQIANQLQNGSLKPEDLNQELISNTYKDLSKAAGNGYGKGWSTFSADGKGSLPNELKKNIYAFSGAKTYAQLQQLNSLLYDQDGKLRPFNEYMVYARKLNRQYNVNWLQSEWQTARTAAQMAEKWQRIQESKNIFPNLKFRTVGDDRVRDDHRALDGIIKPIDDDFWSKYYPPLDWRCRCDVVATAETVTTYKEKDLPAVNFKGNVGKDAEIFTKKGTFFKLANTNENAKRNLELSKLNAPYERLEKGSKVKVNIYADEIDLIDNIDIARVLSASKNLAIDIRPHLDGRLIKNKPNPEYLIDGKLGDRKAPNSKNYKKVLSKANIQGCQVVVIDLSVNKDSVDNALLKISRILNNKEIHPNIEKVYIISGDKKVIKEYKRKKQS